MNSNELSMDPELDIPLRGDMGNLGGVLFRDDFEKGSGVIDVSRR